MAMTVARQAGDEPALQSLEKPMCVRIATGVELSDMQFPLGGILPCLPFCSHGYGGEKQAFLAFWSRFADFFFRIPVAQASGKPDTSPMPEMNPIARIHTDFASKFGIPRQSGLVEALEGRIVFEPAYRNPDALRGIDRFSHLWLIWEFSRAVRDAWSPMVRPPRLGGNTRLGVFATRSPFRPNPIGLSCVRLLRVQWDAPDSPALVVGGADLMDGTPIFDIKPYLPYADIKQDATGGFTDQVQGGVLEVAFPPLLLEKVPAAKRKALVGVLSLDPRPRYQHDPSRIYGLEFAGMDVRFLVDGTRLVVVEVVQKEA